jgi:nitronate monooxygenase
MLQHGDVDAIDLWAGEAHALARALPAAEIVARIAREAESALTALRRHESNG